MANEGVTADIISAMFTAMLCSLQFVAIYLSILLRNNGRYFRILVETRLLEQAAASVVVFLNHNMNII